MRITLISLPVWQNAYAAFCTSPKLEPHEVWSALLRFDRFEERCSANLQSLPKCFETFPFPYGLGNTPRPRSRRGGRTSNIGTTLMVRNDDGMTKTYNRFHDPDENAP